MVDVQANKNTQATKALIKNTVTSIEHPNIVLPSKRLVPTPPAYPPPWHVWAAAHWCDDADPQRGLLTETGTHASVGDQLECRSTQGLWTYVGATDRWCLERHWVGQGCSVKACPPFDAASHSSGKGLSWKISNLKFARFTLHLHYHCLHDYIWLHCTSYIIC